MTRRLIRSKRRQGAQAGISIVEVLVAGAVMVIGFMGTMALILTAIASSNRNKLDSTGAMLGQAVLEQLSSTLVGPGATNINDCIGPHTINTGGAAFPGLGARMSGANIDFSEAAPPDGYHMDFRVCGADNSTATYDVRWNIRTVSGGTALVTVGVKMRGATGNLKYFALPVTVRTYVENEFVP